ncbi:uncharacterized protein MGAL_10B000940 [Mytilus galloprovincialis]|uniref:Fibronectin type-III domain-containing protein n=1 Tax=Mytilus galloprovincialis TaxID=29158 RepID=A0A8B6FD89_MYTGA|nr:uncharacterized protein MGAL_10B000940 [Mytilus galloprovincialis]
MNRIVAFCLPVCIAFKRDCPGPSEREFRAISFCNKSVAFTYSCLYDENRGVNVESCKATVDFAPPGNKYVQRGQPDFTPCEKKRYQPFRLWSNVSGQCIFKKSQCVSDGQFLYNNGTTESDRSCRCDYTHGYAFIKKPKHPCYCIPSEEECSCYKKNCPNNTLLTPEFSPKCIAFLVTAICTLFIVVEGLLVYKCYKGQERHPLPPNDVRLHADTYTDGITVTWSHPSHTSADKRLHFKIKWRVNNSVEEFSHKVAGTVNKFMIPDVFPCEEYKITVIACISEFADTEHGGYYRESEPSVESTITTEEPFPPKDLKAMPDYEGIYLTWSVPEYPTLDKIRHFIVEVKACKKDIINVTSEKTSFRISDVFPSTSYSICMSTCVRAGTEIESDQRQIKTESRYTELIRCKTPEPLPPIDVTASPSPNGILVSWTCPDYPATDKIQCYKLEMTNVNDEKQTREIKPNTNGDGSILMSGVSSKTEYSFTISTAAKCPTSRDETFQLPCVVASVPSKSVKCVSKVICAETKVKEEKKNFLRLEKLLYIANSAVIQKIEKKILSDTNLDVTSLETGKDFLNALSKDQKDDIYSTADKDVSTGSMDYDLVLLLRFWLSSIEEGIPTDKFENTPPSEDFSTQADLSRIYLTRKRYQNSSMKTISALEFDDSWKIVNKAVIRLGGHPFKEKCTRVFRQLSSQISRQLSTAKNETMENHDILEAILQDQEQTTNLQTKGKTSATSDNSNTHDTQVMENVLQLDDSIDMKMYSCLCQDVHILEVSTWKTYQDKLCCKDVIVDLQKDLKDASCAALVGTEREELNGILHHIALEFVQQYKHFVIIPCKTPVEIVQHYKLDRHQLFVLEDACGRMIPLQETVRDLVEQNGNFKQILQAGKTKIMISFTASVYWQTDFPKTDLFFSKCVKDLAPGYSIQYVPKQTVNKVKFENAWTNQLDDWFVNDKARHCSLLIATMHNGCISLSHFKDNSTNKIHQICKEYSLDCAQVEASLRNIPENYISKEDGQFKISNSVMFHFLCCYFCSNKYVHDLFLHLVDDKVFYGKLMLECIQEKPEDECTAVNKSQEESYFWRILDDVSHKDYSVFYSRQMIFPEFRRKLIDRLSKMGGKWIVDAINTKELQLIAITGESQKSPLLFACSQGYEELVSFMLRVIQKDFKDKTLSALYRISIDQGYPLSIISLLKRSGAKIKSESDESWTALSSACLRRNQEIANYLIHEESNVDKADASGTTPVMLACYTGLYKTVDLLIKRGVDLNRLNNRKMSPLKYACTSGHKNIVSLLLDNGVNVNTTYEDGNTPLVVAFQNNHDCVVTLLKNKGFDVDKTDICGRTALAMACTNGNSDTVQSLIELGANLNSRDNEGWVPLSRACKRGEESIVRVLSIEKTVDLNKADNDGWTPLKKASLNGHSKVVEILLNTHKLKIDQADNDGLTPLMSSCQKGHVNVATLLIRGNSDVNYRSNKGKTPLMIATQYEHTEIINLLLENEATINIEDNNGFTPLRVACNVNNDKTIRLFLQKSVDVDKPDKEGCSPLQIACKNDNSTISELLIDAGADVNMQDKTGWTPLKTACKEGNLKICKLLLSQKADINKPDFSGWTPLKNASLNGHTDIVQWLLQNDAIVDKTAEDGSTALMSACQIGHEKIVKLLIEYDACINHQCKSRLTPLIAACDNNKSKVVQFLIEKKADINLYDAERRTPLQYACMKGYKETLEILIEKGADVNKADRRGWTPLKTACRGGVENIVELLLNHDVDINKEDNEGWTPLKSASFQGHYKIVRRLLRKKADIDKVDNEGWTSLMSACKVGNIKVIRVLLEYEADVNIYSKSTGDTPLIIACTYSDGGEIIQLLLEKDADWKWTNNIGQTALLLACMYGKTKNVSTLLGHKVDINVTDKNCVSPLKAACQGLYLEIVELLIKAGADINIVDQNGYTPLISACEKKNIQLVELLIRNNADVNRSTRDGWNPYLFAIKNSDDKTANLLIENGAEKSKSSLLKACEIRLLPIIEFLLDKDRSIESKEIDVMTPLKMVIEKRHFDVLDLFIKKGRTFELDHSMLKDLIDAFDEEGLSALGKACRDANTETLIYLLEHGADIFQPDQRGISPLIYACFNGNKHNVDLLLEKLEKVVDENSKIVLDSCRSYLNKADNDGYTPLTAAASRGHVPLIELLILKGTDVDKLDDCGKAPIMYACEKGDLHTVKSLVSNGASITIISEKTCSPFTLAKRANAWQIVDYLIEMEIRLNHEDLLSISTIESGNEKRNGNDFFTMACKNGYRALVELIINEKQADLNSPDCEGLTPLMHACKMNQTKIVEVIVKNGIDIDSESSEGKTALMFACFEGYTDIAEILLKNQASVNKSDNSGLTSLMVACQKGSLSCVKLLTKYGADMDIKSSALLSAFKIACYTENYEIVDHLVSQESYKSLKYDVRKLLDRTHNNWKELIQSVCKGGYESLFNILIESEDEIDAADCDGNSLILLASQGGHDGIIENLVTRGANINHQNQIGHTALRMACNGGLARSVKILLKNDAHPNKTDAEGRTPLMIVSQGGCLDVVEILIQHHADINLGDRKGTTALMLVAKLGHYDTATYLVTKGADTSKCDNKGLNSVMVACQHGHIAIVRLIAKTKIDLNSSDNDGFTPLRFACDGGHNDIADFLIQNKAEVDKADTRCWTPLKSSSARGEIATVTLLLEKGAEVNKQDTDGWTPLMSACRYGHDNIAELLLNWKAGIDMTEVDGWTALRIACNNGQESTVKFLVSKGANVNKVDKQGWSPLKGACVGDPKNKLDSILQIGKIIGRSEECKESSSFNSTSNKKYEEIVEYLIQNCADVNLSDKDGETCLMTACKGGHVDLVKLLFSNISDINKADNKGTTAFKIACVMGHTKVAELLLTRGADINKSDSNGWTPLKIACQAEHKDTVEMLLRNEANVNIEDNDGWTALMSACTHGNKDIVKSLLENGAIVKYSAHSGSTTPMIIAKSMGHKRVEKLLKRALEGSMNGGDGEDDQEDDEDDEQSDRRSIGRIPWPFPLPFFNARGEDDDDEDSNLQSALFASLLGNNDRLNELN